MFVVTTINEVTVHIDSLSVLGLRTFRKELALRASEDGQALVVRAFNDSHNHQISRVSSSILE